MTRHEDLDRTHELWLRLQNRFGSRLHHRDVVGLAVRRLDEQLHSRQHSEVIADLGRELNRERGTPPPAVNGAEAIVGEHHEGAGLA